MWRYGGGLGVGGDFDEHFWGEDSRAANNSLQRRNIMGRDFELAVAFFLASLFAQIVDVQPNWKLFILGTVMGNGMRANAFNHRRLNIAVGHEVRAREMRQIVVVQESEAQGVGGVGNRVPIEFSGNARKDDKTGFRDGVAGVGGQGFTLQRG